MVDFLYYYFRVPVIIIFISLNPTYQFYFPSFFAGHP